MKSMTGFGRATSSENGRDITVEIKSVNSRSENFPSNGIKNSPNIEGQYIQREGGSFSFCRRWSGER